MKVTICELNDRPDSFSKQWERLITHISEEKSDLLLLPELIFSEWIASSKQVSQKAREESVRTHEQWLKRIEDLEGIYVIYSKPVIQENKFHNTAFVWHSDHGHKKIHTKSFFPEEENFWEETVYDKEDGSFEIVEVENLKIGVLLCTEVWFTQYARQYAKQSIDLLLCPRATGISSVPQWVRCGQTLSVISGAYCLSSNRSGIDSKGFEWGGSGWIAAPMNGELLAQTDQGSPFKTIAIDLSLARGSQKRISNQRKRVTL